MDDDIFVCVLHTPAVCVYAFNALITTDYNGSTVAATEGGAPPSDGTQAPSTTIHQAPGFECHRQSTPASLAGKLTEKYAFVASSACSKVSICADSQHALASSASNSHLQEAR